jgi:hypothetical protein
MLLYLFDLNSGLTYSTLILELKHSGFKSDISSCEIFVMLKSKRNDHPCLGVVMTTSLPQG